MNFPVRQRGEMLGSEVCDFFELDRTSISKLRSFEKAEKQQNRRR